MKKLTKSELESLGLRAGVKVRTAKPPSKPREEKPQEYTLTVPENMLAPLLSAMQKVIESQERTSAEVVAALGKIANSLEEEEEEHNGSTSITAEVIERDESGNIKTLSIGQRRLH